MREGIQTSRLAAFLLPIAGLVLGTGIALAQSSLPELNALADTPSTEQVPKEPKALKSFDLSAMDRTADPCSDFYQYTCGNWMKNNPIPGDQTRWGRFNELIERNQYLLYKELDVAAKPSPSRTPLEVKYGDFYASCMDSAAANAKGLEPLKPALASIAALEDRKQLASLLTNLEREQGTSAMFRFGVEQDAKDSSRQIAGLRQGGLGLPDRDYYLEQDPRQAKIREQYVEHMTNMFKLAGDTPEQAAAEAKSVMVVETALAGGSMSRTEMRDPQRVYNIKTVPELEQMAPAFDWATYFDKIGIAKFDTLNVSQTSFAETLSKQIQSQDLGVWKSYLRWHAIHDAAPWLSDNFVQEDYNFYRATLAGQKELTPRWKRCTRLTDENLGEAVGRTG